MTDPLLIFGIMFSRPTTEQLTEQIRLRQEAEKARNEWERRCLAAERLAGERASTIDDWRKLYYEEVAARADDRKEHAAQIRELLSTIKPATVSKEETPSSGESSQPVTAEEIKRRVASGKREMRERRSEAGYAALREVANEERTEHANRQEAASQEEREQFESMDFDSDLGVLVAKVAEGQEQNGVH